uniref:Uncharacterized protein n=1 Tax=Arion vulgaris TaxID=1028688 RepID=A0A0B7ATY8_9EUPU
MDDQKNDSKNEPYHLLLVHHDVSVVTQKYSDLTYSLLPFMEHGVSTVVCHISQSLAMKLLPCSGGEVRIR